MNLIHIQNTYPLSVVLKVGVEGQVRHPILYHCHFLLWFTMNGLSIGGHTVCTHQHTLLQLVALWLISTLYWWQCLPVRWLLTPFLTPFLHCYSTAETCSTSNVDDFYQASCAHKQKARSMGVTTMANKDTICDARGPCRTIQSTLKPAFLRISTVAQMPRCRDLMIFVVYNEWFRYWCAPCGYSSTYLVAVGGPLVDQHTVLQHC